MKEIIAAVQTELSALSHLSHREFSTATVTQTFQFSDPLNAHNNASVGCPARLKEMI